MVVCGNCLKITVYSLFPVDYCLLYEFISAFFSKSVQFYFHFCTDYLPIFSRKCKKCKKYAFTSYIRSKKKLISYIFFIFSRVNIKEIIALIALLPIYRCLNVVHFCTEFALNCTVFALLPIYREISAMCFLQKLHYCRYFVILVVVYRRKCAALPLQLLSAYTDNSVFLHLLLSVCFQECRIFLQVPL